jgi:hypothetical protein
VRWQASPGRTEAREKEGKFRVMRPVGGGNKEWAVTDLDQEREWCSSPFDHAWLKEYMF